MTNLIETLTSYVPVTVAARIAEQATAPTEPACWPTTAVVMFADISGFTRLTEQLAALGPSGAEDLSRILNAYFGQLVSLVTGYGGDVIKFAGDALLAIWPINEEQSAGDAAILAAQCSLAIQRQLTSYSERQRYPLSLRIGLTMGEAQFYILGGEQGRWEFLMAGDSVRMVSRAEHFAQPGQVVISHAIWQALQETAHGTPLPEGFHLLTAVASDIPIVATTAVDLPPTAVDNLQGYIPGSIKSRLDAGQTGWLAELRRVTVIFLTLPDLTLFDLETSQELIASIQRLLYRFEGSVNKISIDDKGLTLLAAFGLPPLAHEDDPFLALQAAFALDDLLHEYGLNMALAVTTGRTFCGTIGNDTRREYTIIGDVVNLAARLMQYAEQMERLNNGRLPILCDAITYEATQAHIEFAPLPSVQLKGKQDPVAVYRPLGARLSLSYEKFDNQQNRIIGREKERTVLLQALDRLEKGQTTLVMLEGEAGMGKSQLLAALKQLAFERGIGTLSGTGNSIERAASYHGWRGVFGQMFDINILADLEAQKQQFLELIDFYEPTLLDFVPLLNSVLPFDFADTAVTAPLSGQARADNTRNLFVQLLQSSMERSPKIVILDDAHWLDSASWSLALTAVRRVRPMLLVIATRPLPPPRPHTYHELRRLPHTQHLPIEPMPPSDLIELVCARLHVKQLPTEISQLILDRAQGNPFFCEEMAHALRDTGDLIIENGTVRLSKSYNAYETSMPTTVQGIITSRIDRLTPAQQLTLKVASVIGRLFPFGTLHDVYPIAADRTKLTEHLLELERQSLTTIESIEPELAYEFTHVITQEVAYNLLLYEQRRQLHERIASWYEALYFGYDEDEQLLLNADGGMITVEKKPLEQNSFIVPLLVHHHHHAHNTEKEREYALLAAEQAARQFANTEALTYYSRVLELTPANKQRERYESLVAREQIYHLLGRRAEQKRDLLDLAMLAEELNDDRSRAWVALRHTVYELAISDYQQAVETVQMGITLAAMLEERSMEATGYLQWGLALIGLGEYDQAIIQLEKANYQARLLGEREIEAASLQSLGQIFTVQGEVNKARSYFMQALLIRREIGDKRGEARGLNNIGRVLQLQGEFEKARSYLEQSLDLNREIGDVLGEARTLDELTHVYNNLGHYTRAYELATAALKLKRDVSDRQGEAETLNILGVTAVNLSQYQTAREAYQIALAVQQEIGDRRGRGQALANLGMLAYLQGNYAQARQNYLEALPFIREVRDRMLESWLYHHLGNLCLAEGQYEHGRVYYQYTLGLQRRISYTKGQCATLIALGNHARHVGQYELGLEYVMAGLEKAREISYPKGQALAHLHRSQLLRTVNEPNHAYVNAEKALTFAQRTGLKSFEAHALTNIAHALYDLARYTEALTLYNDALEIRQRLVEPPWLLDVQIGLMRTWHALGNNRRAYHLAQQIRETLTAVCLLGSEEPFQNLLSLIEILTKNNDPHAMPLYIWAQTLLHEKAQLIQDDILRHNFLYRVESHRRLGGGSEGVREEGRK